MQLLYYSSHIRAGDALFYTDPYIYIYIIYLYTDTVNTAYVISTSMISASQPAGQPAGQSANSLINLYTYMAGSYFRMIHTSYIGICISGCSGM